MYDKYVFCRKKLELFLKCKYYWFGWKIDDRKKAKRRKKYLLWVNLLNICRESLNFVDFWANRNWTRLRFFLNFRSIADSSAIYWMKSIVIYLNQRVQKCPRIFPLHSFSGSYKKVSLNYFWLFFFSFQCKCLSVNETDEDILLD